jgi:hypothetical protein
MHYVFPQWTDTNSSTASCEGPQYFTWKRGPHRHTCGTTDLENQTCRESALSTRVFLLPANLCATITVWPATFWASACRCNIKYPPLFLISNETEINAPSNKLMKISSSSLVGWRTDKHGEVFWRNLKFFAANALKDKLFQSAVGWCYKFLR